MNENGGLAEITVEYGDGRCSIKIGNIRLLDIVIGPGKRKWIEYKISKKGTVTTDPQKLIAVLRESIAG